MNTEFDRTYTYTLAAVLVWVLLLIAASLAGHTSRKEKLLSLVVLLVTTAGGYVIAMMTLPAPVGWIRSGHRFQPDGILGAVAGFLLGTVLFGLIIRFKRIVLPADKKEPVDNDEERDKTPINRQHSRWKELLRLALICFAGWEFLATINAATLLFLAHDFNLRSSLESNSTVESRFDHLAHVHRSHSALSALPTRWLLIPDQSRFVIETREMIEQYEEYRKAHEGLHMWSLAELKESPPVQMPDWILQRLKSDEGEYIIPLIFSPILPAEYEDRAAQCLNRTIVTRHVLPH